MKETKLIELIRSFNKEEFKRFGEFVGSPYFNKLQNLFKLYRYISKHYPSFSAKGFTKENAFAEIFPGEKFDDGRVRALSSYLLTLAEKFLAYNKYSEDEFRIRLDISTEMRRKGNRKLLNENLSVMEKLLSEYKYKDESFYYKLFQLTYEKNTAADYFKSEKKFDEEANIFLTYSIITFLKIYTTALNSLKSVNLEFNEELADSIIAIIKKEPFASNPAIKIHYSLYNLLKHDDEKYFFELLELIDKHPDILKSEEMYESFVILLNFCVIRIQKGFREFAMHKFNLYKIMLENNVPMIESNYFSYTFFNNIVTSALEMKEFEWAKDFIEEYKVRLDENYKNDVVNLCYAKLNYFLKEYEEALNYLSRCGSNENIYYRFALKDLQIKILYELEHYESIFSIIDSYKHFFHKNKLIAKPVKERYYVFLKKLNQFIKLKSKNNVEDIILFKQKLNSEPSFLYKDWIIEKINQ